MLIDKNIFAACGISLMLHGVIFSVSGLSIVPGVEKKIPEEIPVNLKIENPVVLPKIRTLGDMMKVKKTLPKIQHSEANKSESFDRTPLCGASELTRKDSAPDKRKPEIKPVLKNNIKDSKPQELQSDDKADDKLDPKHPDKEAMLEFHDMVKQRIEEARRYPLWAQKRGIQGVTQMAFTLMADGTVKDIQILSSSGSGILDEEAVETVNRAVPFPAFPHKMKTPFVRMNVGIVFSLQRKY